MNFASSELTPGTLAGLVVAASFAAGLNIYATILTLGVLARAHWVELPPGLDLLAQWWVIAVCAVLFAVEFVADKIPAFDLVWNALHTFVRIPLAALLAYRATLQLSPGMQVLATTAGALIALAAHGSKTAARTLVTPSPEPVSNIMLSTGEDAAAIGLTWTATHHPWIAGGVAAGLTIAAVLTAKWILGAIRKTWSRIWSPERAAV
jgi:hypothetical protein